MHNVLPAATENPWATLPTSAPYVASADAPILSAHNLSAPEHYRMHLDILPEPYLGNPDAPIVLLSLNPGYTKGEERFHELDAYFREVSMRNMLHDPMEYPFYFLDPSKKSPGHKWWQQRLGAVVQLYGNRVVARNVFCVEYYPYHSTSFPRNFQAMRVPSQLYSFELVRRAIKRGAAVVLLRSQDAWLDAVRELAQARYYTLNSKQNVALTPNNCPDGFGAICAILRAAA